ncbi:TPA: hypothetical protein ACG3H9_002370 [Clostridioides difficile]
MDFFINTIISGAIYDLIKKGAIITGQIIKNNLNVQLLDDTIYDEIANRINLLSYNEKNNLEKLNNAISNNKEFSEFLNKNIIYKTEFAKRLDYIVSLLNQGNSYVNVNLELLGEFLGFESVNELKCYYNKCEYPTYKFIDTLAENLGINKSWLKNGNGKIFKQRLEITFMNDNYFDIIKEKNPQDIIIALLNKNNEAKLGLILRINNFKYEYSNYLNIVCNPGETGKNQIFSIYKLIKDLKFYKMPTIYELSEIDFDSIFSGELYPGIVTVKGKNELWWVDDFLDINYHQNSKINYQNNYGEYFIHCQNIVKKKLSSIEI